MKVEFNVLARFPNATGDAELSYRVKLPFPPDVPLLAIDAPPFQDNDCFRYRVPAAFRVIADGNAPVGSGPYNNAVTFWSDPNFLNQLEVRIFKVNNQTDGDSVRIKTVRLKVTTAPDSDGDGWPDSRDACPANPTKFVDAGVCGCEIDLPESACQDCNGNGVSDDLDGISPILGTEQILWRTSAGGDWADPNRWCQRVGESAVPDSFDLALFDDRDVAQSITLSANRTVGGLELRDSSFSFNAPGRTLRVSGSGVGGLFTGGSLQTRPGGSSELRVIGGTMQFDDALIVADQGDARLLVEGSQSLLTTGGGIRADFGGQATIEIRSGGRVISTGGFDIGPFPGRGALTVEGSGSLLRVSGGFGMGVGFSDVVVRDGGEIDIRDPGNPFERLAVGVGATLSGDGTIRGPVESFSRIAPGRLQGNGRRTGVLLVDGDFTQFSIDGESVPDNEFPDQDFIGDLLVTFTPPADAPRLQVTGLATLAGTMNVRTFQDQALTRGSDAVVLDAAAGIAAEFDAIYVSPALPGGQFVTVDYVEGPGNSEQIVLGVASLGVNTELGGPESFTVSATPTDVVAADMNGDGNEDLVLVIPAASGQAGNLTILLADANGDYTTQVTILTAINPRGVAVADFDQAGGPDIVVTGFGDDTVRFYSTDGVATPTITFERSLGVADLPLLDEPYDVAAGQLNAAGAHDVVFASSGSNHLYLLEALNLGFDFVPCEIPTKTRPKQVAFGDIDGDQNADFLASFAGSGPGVSAFTSSDGFGRVDYDLSAEPGELLLDDLDRDGVDDGFAVVPGADRAVFLRNTGASLETPTDLPVGENPVSLTSADLDRDGDIDVATITGVSGARVVQVLRNDTLNSGELVLAQIEPDDPGPDPAFVRAADADGDGQVDLVTLDAGNAARSSARTQGGVKLPNISPPPPCVADVTTDGSANGIPDGEVTLSDFSFYLTLWSAASPRADVTTDGTSNGLPDGTVTLSDFSYYLVLWSAGCP